MAQAKHTFNLSDEQVVHGWVENPYWQFFCGEEFFRHKLPINPCQMTRWRQRIGEKGVEKLLQITIEAGIQACPGNPFDGHTLDGQLDQVERLTGKLPALTFVDRGYKGHGVPEDRSRVLISGTRKLSYTLKRHLRRRSAVEPEIGHMKADGLLGWNFLKGMQGDAMNAILCGAGHNLRKILARLRALLCLLSGDLRATLQAVLDHIEATAPLSTPHRLPESAKRVLQGRLPYPPSR